MEQTGLCNEVTASVRLYRGIDSTIVYIPSVREVSSLSSAVLSVTNCVFPCHFKTDITDMTQSNSDFVTDDQFPILRVQTFQRSVSVVVWLEPLETENIGATLSRHPGHPGSPGPPGPPGPPHTSIMVIIITETGPAWLSLNRRRKYLCCLILIFDVSSLLVSSMVIVPVTRVTSNNITLYNAVVCCAECRHHN